MEILNSLDQFYIPSALHCQFSFYSFDQLNFVLKTPLRNLQTIKGSARGTFFTHLRKVCGQDAALVVESRALHTLEQLEEILGGCGCSAQAFRTVGDAARATSSARRLLLLCVGHKGMLTSAIGKQETG